MWSYDLVYYMAIDRPPGNAGKHAYGGMGSAQTMHDSLISDTLKQTSILNKNKYPIEINVIINPFWVTLY